MSLRPRNGAPNPGRGGDGRRARWSESPIPRVGKRRVRMTGAVSLTMFADTIVDCTEADAPGIRDLVPIVYTGGAGQNTLLDGSDSTYVTVRDSVDWATTSPFIATFAAAYLPAGATIASITLNVRARTSTADADVEFGVAEDIAGTGNYYPLYATWSRWSAGARSPGTDWTDMAFTGTEAGPGTGEWEAIPSVALLNSGTLQVAMSTQAFDGYYDLSALSLTVTLA